MTFIQAKTSKTWFVVMGLVALGVLTLSGLAGFQAGSVRAMPVREESTESNGCAYTYSESSTLGFNPDCMSRRFCPFGCSSSSIPINSPSCSSPSGPFEIYISVDECQTNPTDIYQMQVAIYGSGGYLTGGQLSHYDDDWDGTWCVDSAPTAIVLNWIGLPGNNYYTKGPKNVWVQVCCSTCTPG
jgi:hypothetical protein